MDFNFIIEYKDEIIGGFIITLQATFLSLILAMILGTILALFSISTVKILRLIGITYVEFIRNVPLLIIIFIFYYGLPALGVNLPEFVCGFLGLSIYNAAFISEIVRAGIQSISKGQTEAARSTGMTYLQSMRYIVLPQAFKVVIPPLGNQLINIVKGTSILGVIAGGDLVYQADRIASYTFKVFEVYIFVAVLYLLITIPLSLSVNYLQKRFSQEPGR